MTGRMTKIKLDEISLVDYPAHMIDGFPIIKSATTTESDRIMDALGKRNTPMPTDEELVAKALQEISPEDLKKALSERDDFEDIEKAFTPEVAPVATETATVSTEDIYKGLPDNVVAILKDRDEKIAKAEEKADAAEVTAGIEKAKRLDREAVDVSKATWSNLAFDHEVFAPAFRKFADADPEAAKAVETVFKAVNEQADGTIFKELGTSAPGATGSASSQIETIAKALIADGKASDLPDGIAKATADPANKTLVDAYFKGE